MDVLPAEDTLKEIQPVSDDIEEQIEKLKRRELLPANVLIELCEIVSIIVFSHFLGKRNNSQRKQYSSSSLSSYCMWRHSRSVL